MKRKYIGLAILAVLVIIIIGYISRFYYLCNRVHYNFKERYTENRISGIASLLIEYQNLDYVLVETNETDVFLSFDGHVLPDAWNNLINYYDVPSGFVLASAGSDLIKGTDDDIAIQYCWTNDKPLKYYALTFVGEFTGAYEGKGGGSKITSWKAGGSKTKRLSPSFEWMHENHSGVGQK